MHSLKIIVLSFLMSFSSMVVIAQKGTQSPYSVFGLGELNNGQYAYFMAMGNVLTANTDSTIVNQNNPASYAYIARFRPLFQIAMNAKFSKFSDSNGSSNQRQLGLNQFQLGLPIAKNWGGAFGLTPYSSTGYKIFNTQVNDGDTVSQLINEGAGTISKFHFGTAYKHNFKNKSKLSLGLNVNYLFGISNKIESFEYANFPNSALHSRVENKTKVNALNFDLGLIYEQYLKNSSYSVGLKFSPATNLKAKQDLLAYNYSESYYNNYSYPFQVIDTAEFITNNLGTIYLPQSFNFGAEYRFHHPEKGYFIKISSDVKYQKWSNYYEEFSNVKTSPNFKDRVETGIGIQYSPHIGRNANNTLTPWLSKLHYRVGFNYTLSELFVNSTQITNYGISFGLGIPVTTGNSNTNINFGAKYGSLGTTNSGLIKEDYLGIYFGVSISPGIYDRWFLKRKYD